MQIYNSKIVTKNRTFEIKIENNFNYKNSNSLKFTINNVVFSGSCFDDFSIAKTDIDKLSEFSLDFNIFEHAYLCNCLIICEIPIFIIQNQTNPILKFILHLGEPTTNGGLSYEFAEFELFIDNKIIKIQTDDFETALKYLQNQIKPTTFKTCLFCDYSDYNPAGQGFFGNLYCFKNCKPEFLNHTSKQELFDLIFSKSLPTQEIWFCDEFNLKK